MSTDEEMKLLLRGIERLRYELSHIDMDADIARAHDVSSRLNNLLSCLSRICWTKYGDRTKDHQSA